MKLAALLPFMESDDLKELALKIIEGEVKGVKLVILYPFLRGKDLDEIIDICLEKGYTKEVKHALPFVNQETIKKIYQGVKDGSIEGIKEHSIFPFLGRSELKEMFDELVKEATENASESVDEEVVDEIDE